MASRLRGRLETFDGDDEVERAAELSRLTCTAACYADTWSRSTCLHRDAEIYEDLAVSALAAMPRRRGWATKSQRHLLGRCRYSVHGHFVAAAIFCALLCRYTRTLYVLLLSKSEDTARRLIH